MRRLVSLRASFTMPDKPKPLPVADATLHFVDPDSKLGFAIGKFIVAWGDLEQQLDIGFHVLFHTDPTLAVCLYANLGTKAKIDILQSAIALQEKPIGNGRASRARKVLQKIAALSDEARLTTAHGQVWYYEIEGKSGHRWEWVRHIARSKPKITVHPSTSRYWNAQANYARKLAAHWRQLVTEIYSKLQHLTLADLQKICAIETQVARSPRSRRRKLPPRRIHALQDRLTIRARWPRT